MCENRREVEEIRKVSKIRFVRVQERRHQKYSMFANMAAFQHSMVIIMKTVQGGSHTISSKTTNVRLPPGVPMSGVWYGFPQTADTSNRHAYNAMNACIMDLIFHNLLWKHIRCKATKQKTKIPTVWTSLRWKNTHKSHPNESISPTWVNPCGFSLQLIVHHTLLQQYFQIILQKNLICMKNRSDIRLSIMDSSFGR